MGLSAMTSTRPLICNLRASKCMADSSEVGRTIQLPHKQQSGIGGALGSLRHSVREQFFWTASHRCALRPNSSGVRCTILEQQPPKETRAPKLKQKPPKGKKRAAQKRVYDLGSIQQAEAEAIAKAIAQAPAHEFDEFDMYRGLVLDVSYKPIDIINWKRAICMDLFQKADVLTYYDQYVHSAYAAYPLPAVLRIPNYVNLPKQRMRVMLSRSNILIRDKNKCQYCGSRDDLTIDHVVAASRGGEWSWTNLVAACGACNLKKGNMSVAEAGMRLLRQPREPTESDFPPLSHKNLGGRNTPPEWYDYLPNRLQFFQ